MDDFWGEVAQAGLAVKPYPGSLEQPQLDLYSDFAAGLPPEANKALTVVVSFGARRPRLIVRTLQDSLQFLCGYCGSDNYVFDHKLKAAVCSCGKVYSKRLPSLWAADDWAYELEEWHTFLGQDPLSYKLIAWSAGRYLLYLMGLSTEEIALNYSAYSGLLYELEDRYCE